jgi:fermentation-respiration switch protein FrsA (DUF1100 family)
MGPPKSKRPGAAWRLASWPAACLMLVGCVHHAVATSPYEPVEFQKPVVFYNHPLAVHFARPAALQPGTPLLLFATGDGGWRGKDRELYGEIIRWGYPVAGFSAPSYLSHLGFVSGTTTPGRLARDYERLIEFAKEALSLPARTRTILVGVSRGAGLAVVAAGRAEVRPLLAGVMAVALTREEEYVRHYRVRRGAPGDAPKRELVTFDTYGSLYQLRLLPLAVIQSTNDNYLPAVEARELFGPDTELRHFFPIEAQNHSFKGARDALYARMSRCLDWICKEQPAATE